MKETTIPYKGSDMQNYTGECLDKSAQCYNLTSLEADLVHNKNAGLALILQSQTGSTPNPNNAVLKPRDVSNLQPWLSDLPNDKKLASPFDTDFYTYSTLNVDLGGVCMTKSCGSDREEPCYDGDGKPYCIGKELSVNYIDAEEKNSIKNYLGCSKNISKTTVIEGQ